MKYFTIDQQLFPVDIHVVVGGTANDVIDKLSIYSELDRNLIKEHMIPSEEEGVTIWCDAVGIIWLHEDVKVPEDIGVIVHESLHLTHAILAFVGLSLSDATEEVYAYFIDFIVRRIVEELK